jgi:hypothetical protein
VAGDTYESRDESRSFDVIRGATSRLEGSLMWLVDGSGVRKDLAAG